MKMIFFSFNNNFKNIFLLIHNIQSQKKGNKKNQKNWKDQEGGNHAPPMRYLSSRVTLLTDDGWTSPLLRQLLRFVFLLEPSQC